VTPAPPAPTPAVRAASVADAAALAEVFVAAWRGEYRGVVPDAVIDALDPAEETDHFARLLAGPDLTTVVAPDHDGSVVGFARFGADPERPRDSGVGYLAALYVHPRAGRAGVGRTLLRHAIDAMADEGRAELGLWVFAANRRARDLYERHGFRPTGAEVVEARWQAPQVRLRRARRDEPRRLVPLPEVRWAPITSVAVEPLRRPLRRPFRTALREVRELTAWSVTVRTGDGGVGTGTTVATPQITGDTDGAIEAAGTGPLTAAVLGTTDLGAALAGVAAFGRVPSARAAVDLALHDLAAAQAGTTVAALLGSVAAGVASDMTIGLDSVEAMARAATDAVADGFRTLKVKLGDPGGTLDVARMLAVRDALAVHPHGGGVALRLDANQAWTPRTACEVIDGLVDAGMAVELVEQPVAAADLAGMAEVRRHSPYPLLADESVFGADDVHRVAGAGAADLVNLKLLKCGGLWPARQVVDACVETGLGLLIGCMIEPAAGIAAATALAGAACRGPLAHDLDATWWVG
jgi:L-alanine-DL-glutamate epimerase-like enolase superfamily enzyme/ribosomal protein S18 acetylase RimI-like enzyme